MRRTILIFLLAMTTTLAAFAESPLQRLPSVVSAEPAAEWSAKFSGKHGWIGGDGVYSALLNQDRVLWLFGDSLIGEVTGGGRSGSVMVKNTLAIQSGTGPNAPIEFITGATENGKPTAFFTPADGEGWLWPLAAVRVDDRLVVFLAQLEKAGDGPFGFKAIGQWLGVVDNPDESPDEWRVKQHKLPFAEFESDHTRSWGSAVLLQQDDLYVYGNAERGKGLGRKQLLIARMSANQTEDFKSWRFRTADGWIEDPADAAPLADGLATEMSVTPLSEGGYALVYTENGIGDRIVGRFSAAPEGPWSDPILLYKCPEMKNDRGVFSYSAKAHAWAAGEDELLISYCVNTWEFSRLFQDETVYRPKFVRVKLRQ